MRLDLSLRQLEAFVQVAASGSFRRAAAQLGQAQPVLSRLIGQAEQTLGARLFDRDTRRVEITPAGRELLPLAQRLLRDFDHTLGDFGAFMAGRSGRVSMVVLPSVSVAWVPRAMAAFARTHPQVNFALTEAPADTLLALLEAGRADFIAEADYRKTSKLSRRMELLLDAVVADIAYRREAFECRAEHRAK